MMLCVGGSVITNERHREIREGESEKFSSIWGLPIEYYLICMGHIVLTKKGILT